MAHFQRSNIIFSHPSVQNSECRGAFENGTKPSENLHRTKSQQRRSSKEVMNRVAKRWFIPAIRCLHEFSRLRPDPPSAERLRGLCDSRTTRMATEEELKMRLYSIVCQIGISLWKCGSKQHPTAPHTCVDR
jgi:hypothetical protein